MKLVTVLMSTYNGEEYINTQIESLVSQRDVDIKILVRDDGSTDNTISILKEWQSKGVLEFYSGSNIRPAKSFMELVYNAPESNYYAFCDQDDVWEEDKLINAVNMLSEKDNNKPSLYFSRAKLVDKNLNYLGYSDSNPAYSLPGILLGSHAIGCTMVFNRQLLNLLRENPPRSNILHDAWTIRVCLAVDGNVVFDKNSYINYRQHGNNVVGASKSNIKRYLRIINNSIKNKNQKSRSAQELLEVLSQHMSQESVELVYLAANYKDSIQNRISLAMNKKFRRNNYVDNFLFIIAVLLGYF